MLKGTLPAMIHRSNSSLLTPLHALRFQRLGLIASLAIFLLALPHTAKAAAVPAGQSAPAKPCAFSDASFNPATDVRALEKYKDAIAHLLKDRSFSKLDCIADAARSGKTRFSGGAWKLHNFYQGLDSPRPGHPTEEDWQKHVQLVQQWRDKYPQSVTARVALAKSYVSYAWDARGNGKSDTVSDNGWTLFEQRLVQAKTILDDSASTPGKDPEWYYDMQQISLGQSWDEPKSADLFNHAIAFEPQYYYYLQMRAKFLQPKWYGKPGDSERSAKALADVLGGDDGDILYFQSAVGIVCGCNEPDVNDFSWERLQKGYTALENKYGASLISTNYAAFMALKANQLEAADSMFKRIGDNWDEDIWITEDWFKQNRDYADSMAPMLAMFRIFRKNAEDNLKSAGGQAYQAEVEAKLTQFERPCVTAENIASSKFQIFIEIGKDGSTTNLHVKTEDVNAMAHCIMNSLYAAQVKKDILFPAPSKAPYAVVVEVDPGMLKTASK